MVEIVNCSNCGRLRAAGRACPSCGDVHEIVAAPSPLPEAAVQQSPAEPPRQQGRTKRTALHIMGLVLILIVIGAIAAVGLPVWINSEDISNEELAAKVQANMQKLLPNNPDYADVRLDGTLTLESVGDNVYNGSVLASKAGEPFMLTVNVTYDGEGFMWRILPSPTTPDTAAPEGTSPAPTAPATTAPASPATSDVTTSTAPQSPPSEPAVSEPAGGE